MKTSSFIYSHLATTFVVLVSGPFGTPALADQNWDGDNSLGNFTYGNNWYGDFIGGLGGFGFANGNLHFSYRNNASQSTLYYDFAGWTDTNDIFWDSTFGASLQWDGNGQGLNFNQRLENISSFTQTLGVTMNLSGARNGAAQIELNPVNGNLVINGTIFNDHSVPYYAWGDNGKTLTLNSTLGVGGTPSNVSLNIAQNSAVVVAASQTYAGNTVISAGSLSTTGTGTLGGGSYAGAIINNGTLTIGTSANQLLSGNIGGSGPLIKDGTGTLTLSGANTFSGDVTVKAGILQLGAAGPGDAGASGVLGAINNSVTKVRVTAGATLDINGKYNTNYGVTIAGTGSAGQGALVNASTGTNNTYVQLPNIALSADATIGGSGNFHMIANASYGPNTLTLNDHTLTKAGINNFHLCNTTITSGIVRISGGAIAQNRNASAGANGSAAAFVLDDTAGASLNLNGKPLSVGSLAGGGSTGGNVNLETATLTVGALGGDTAYGGTITSSAAGGALRKTGSGSLTLAGSNLYTGTTTVSQGTLVVNGSLAAGNAVTVEAGGTLGGTGTVNGTVNAAGRIAPGTSVGTLKVGSTILTGTYACGIDGATADQLDAATLAGTLDVTGSTVTFTILNAPTQDSYVIATYTGTLGGTFAKDATLPSGYDLDYSTAGQIKLVKMTGGYASWAHDHAGDQAPDDDYDGDGVSNGIEYFMHPADGFTANPGVVDGKVTWPNGGRIPFGAYGFRFVVETSHDLMNWTPVGAGDPNLHNTSASVEYTLPAGGGMIFVRLSVTPY